MRVTPVRKRKCIDSPGVRMDEYVGHNGEIVGEEGEGPPNVQPHQMVHCQLVAGRLLGHHLHQLGGQPASVLGRPVHQPVIDRPLVRAGHALAPEMIVGQRLLLPEVERRRVEVKAVVDVDFGAAGNRPHHAHNLVALVAEADGVGIAAVVEEGHSGKDGPTHGDDVELGDVVVLEDALGHLEAVGGGNLEVAEDEAGYEDLGPK